MTEAKLLKHKKELAEAIAKKERLIKTMQGELATLTAETIKVNYQLLKSRGSER